MLQLPSDLQCTRKPASDLTPAQLDNCYKLARKIRGLYLAAGDRWDRRAKLSEMSNTPGLVYHLIVKQEDADDIVAFTSYVLDDEDDFNSPTTFIYELHVSLHHRGQGLGSYLLNQVQDLAPASLMLRTFTCNKNAVGFYQAFGFELDARVSDEKIIYMVKKLNI